MDNHTVLNAAIQLLQDVESHNLETIQISRNKYDDGSTGFTVELVYPSVEVVETESFYDGNGEEVKVIHGAEGSA